MSEIEHNGVLITGGYSGLGEAAAEAFMEEGWDVAILGRNESLLEETATSLNNTHAEAYCYPVAADVTSEAGMRRAFQEAEIGVGGLSVVVNNAALLVEGHIEDVPAEQAHKVITTNIMGLRNSLDQARQPLLASAEQSPDHVARFVHIGSILSPTPDKPDYYASKKGAEGMLEAAGRDLKTRGVDVTLFNPGAMTTATKSVLGDGEKREQQGGLTPQRVAQHLFRVAATHPSEYVPRYDVMARGRFTGR